MLQMICAQPVSASYDRMVTWSDMATDIDISQILKTPYASRANLFESNVSASSIEVALRDADGKIGSEFHIPASMRASVEFWLRVYTQYTTQQQVIFDARHPEIVYEVLDFKDIADTSRNAVVYEIRREHKLKSTLRAYAAAFDHLKSQTKSRKSSKKASKAHKPSREEERILAAIKALKHKHTFGELRSNLRSQSGQRDNVMKGLLAAEAFLPRMEQIFTSVGVPPELTRLALVESSFDLRAYSRVGAVGVWQFMPNTGRRMLTIDHQRGIDERLSPIKSSVAAARLLRENYQQFKSWPLAVTSYNHGLRGLTKFRRSKGARDFREIAHLFDPCSSKSPLGWAGRNYYAEFLAMLHAEAYHGLFYGDVPSVQTRPLAYQRVEKNKTAMTIAMENGISIQRFRQSNPDIRNIHGKIPVGFWIALPGDADDFAGLTRPKSSKKRMISIARLSKKTRKV
ncbi:MAG: lytic transglycosylase domain-containing protein [Bdellovibrionia bacterium]